MQLYKLNSSSRGRFIVPNKGGRHRGFHHHQHISTNGTGLLISKQPHGVEVSYRPNNPLSYLTPTPSAQNMSSLQNKLSNLSLTGKGIGKKKYISFKI